MGNGYTCDESNILSIIDRQLFGEAHLYQKSPIDPEGFVSTLSAIAHTCIGFFMWKMDNTKPSDRKQSAPFVLDRIILMSIGYLLADALPLNKKNMVSYFCSGDLRSGFHVTCHINVLYRHKE